MAIEIDIRYHYPEVQGNMQSYDLRVEVSSATEMPEDIFVMQKGIAPARDGGGEPTDQFICLADPSDLEEYPPDAPALEQDIPYYRVKDITLRFRDMDTLNETQVLLAADIQNLVNALKAADSFAPTDDVTYN